MGRKIKVVRIINRFNIGGPTFNATLLTKFLEDEFDTTLIGGLPDEGEKNSLHILKEYGVEPILLEEMKRDIGIIREYKAYRKIKKIIRDVKPDIVHTHASKSGFLGRMAALSENVPVILHTFHGHVFHDYFGKAKTELFRQIEKYLASRTTGIIAISDIQKHELGEVYKIAPMEKIKMIPLGFELRKFTLDKEEKRKAVREKYKITPDEVAIAITGRLAPIKDHSYFLDVVEKLLKQTAKKIKVFIVGDGSERQAIEQRVDEINQKYPNSITMTSWILDIATFNQGMDIVVLTSKNEGTPVSIIEAEASRVAVISTDVGGVRDVIVDGESGFVVNKEDFETYVEKLRLLVENDALRRKFSIFGEHNVMENYDYTRLVKNMRFYYKSLLK